MSGCLDVLFLLLYGGQRNQMMNIVQLLLDTTTNYVYESKTLELVGSDITLVDNWAQSICVSWIEWDILGILDIYIFDNVSNSCLLRCGILQINPTFTTFKPRHTPLLREWVQSIVQSTFKRALSKGAKWCTWGRLQLHVHLQTLLRTLLRTSASL